MKSCLFPQLAVTIIAVVRAEPDDGKILPKKNGWKKDFYFYYALPCVVSSWTEKRTKYQTKERMKSFSFFFAWSAQALPRETRTWTSFCVFRLSIFFLSFLLSHFYPRPIFFSLLVFLLFSIFSFEFLPPTNNRRSPVKKSDTVDTLLYYFSPLFAVMVPLRYDLC